MSSIQNSFTHISNAFSGPLEVSGTKLHYISKGIRYQKLKNPKQPQGKLTTGQRVTHRSDLDSSKIKIGKETTPNKRPIKKIKLFGSTQNSHRANRRVQKVHVLRKKAIPLPYVDQPASIAEPIKHSYINPKVKAKTEEKLEVFGLTQDEYDILCLYVEVNHTELQNEPVHIRRTDVDPPLPRSLVVVPQGRFRGTYALLKTKGGITEIGIGAFNRVTLALHLETGEKKVFRTGRAEDVDECELNANQEYYIFDRKGEYFVTGIPVEYKGPWSKRNGRKLNESKDHLVRYRFKKIGLIMDFIPDGNLFYSVVRTHRLTKKESVRVCLHLAKGIQIANVHGYVNLDLKNTNIFMDDKTPKMGDLGGVYRMGDTLHYIATTLGYIAPEIIGTSIKNPFTVTPATEMWIIGCLMAEITGREGFIQWNEQVKKNSYKEVCDKICDPKLLNKALNYYFPERDNKKSIDHVIVRCLEHDPTKRIAAYQLVFKLQGIYDRLADTQSSRPMGMSQGSF